MVVDEDKLCAVRLDEFTALLADRVGHDNAHVIALDRADERKTDALIAAGRLHDDGVGADQTALFRLGDHTVRCARFDRAADIDALVFDEDIRAVRRDDAREFDHRRVADGFQNI